MSITIQNPFLIVLLGMLFVISSIIWFRLHAFLALLLGAFVVAFFTSAESLLIFANSKGFSPEAIQALLERPIGLRIAHEFGQTCAKIGILIAMASIIGKGLMDSGAAEKIVRVGLKYAGEKRAPQAFLGSSFFIGIPVFFDTVFYLLVPLAKAMAIKLNGRYLFLVLCISAGAAMANSLVPPTPGPLYLIGEFNIPIVMMIAGGCIVGAVTITVGYLFARWADHRWQIPVRDSVDAPLDKIREISSMKETTLPKLWTSVLPILIPIALISTKAIWNALSEPSTASDLDGQQSILYQIVDFLGEKNMALVSGAIASLFLLVWRNKGNRQQTVEAVQSALSSAGMIILITAAGGAFGGMLQQTGISSKIAELTNGFQLALIPLAFLVTAIVRTAQGSATVAMITAAGILSGLADSNNLDFHPLYLGLAVACGSKLIPWMNDSGFWIVCKMSNLTEKEALRTFSPLLTIMGISGLIVVMIGAALFPLK